MKILDLFCGACGASFGMSLEGHKLVGVDINPQHDYPFEFVKSDVFDLDKNFIKEFDFIWSSPPCQTYSLGSLRRINEGREYPSLIEPTRELLKEIGKPAIIENVPLAPIRHDLLLCGQMFGLKLIRHRFFEFLNCAVPQPIHKFHKGVSDNGDIITVAGHGWKGSTSIQTWSGAMGIFWIKDKNMLAEAIPPKYSNYIITHILLGEDARGFKFW